MSTDLTVQKAVELNASAARVWEALTNPEITREYFFDCEALSDWKAGSDIVFKMMSDGKETVAVKGVIEAIEPERLLQYTCFTPENESDPKTHTTVTCKLTPSGDSTTVSISQGPFRDQETFNHTAAGWDMVLDGLKRAVTG